MGRLGQSNALRHVSRCHTLDNCRRRSAQSGINNHIAEHNGRKEVAPALPGLGAEEKILRSLYLAPWRRGRDYRTRDLLKTERCPSGWLSKCRYISPPGERLNDMQDLIAQRLFQLPSPLIQVDDVERRMTRIERFGQKLSGQ